MHSLRPLPTQSYTHTRTHITSRLYRICNHDLSGSELDRLLPALGDALVLGITAKEALRGVVDLLEFVLDRAGLRAGAVVRVVGGDGLLFRGGVWDRLID